MKFYNRTSEIASLKQIEKISATSAQMTMIVGRRRVGKTTLLKQSYGEKPMLYFFVAKKNEKLLCDEFAREAEEKLGYPLGSFSSFALLFNALMQLSEKVNFTLIIDEFQEFMIVNSSIYSDMQNIWDSRKSKSRINLVLCGSIYSLMKRIFEHSKEPLFGRITSKIHVKPFDLKTMREILTDYNPKHTNEDLLTFYMITGGVAKYIEQLIIYKAFSKKEMLDAIFSDNSFFLEEGKDVLIGEFGKDYGNYFSVLSLIASSKTDRSSIESILNMPVGGFLDKLEKDYNIITRNRPFMAKEGSRSIRYKIEDNFLNFWFRFIFKYRSTIEIGNYGYVREIVERDYEMFSGLVLEKYFRTKLIETMEYSDVKSYWNNKGEDEIDIVAINEMNMTIEFYEVKRNPQKINLSALESKARKIVAKFPDYKIEYKGLSLEDM